VAGLELVVSRLLVREDRETYLSADHQSTPFRGNQPGPEKEKRLVLALKDQTTSH